MRSLALGLLLLTACTRNPESSEAEPIEAPEAPTAHAPAEAPAQPAPPARTGQGGGETFDPAHPAVAGITFQVPPPFSFRMPSPGSMRLAEYVVPEREGERPASLTIHHFAGMGGAIRDNVNRWVAQFTGTDGAPVTSARITNRTVAGMEVTMVDVSGTYRGMNFGGAPTAAEPNHRLIGAIVNAPAGPVFFKLVGPVPVVERAVPAFTLLVDSFEPAR